MPNQSYPLIDLHTHILPARDDGVRDMEQAIAMAKIAVNDGITMLAATPHVITGKVDNSRADILNAVTELNQILAGKKIPLQVLPGAEYRLEPDLPRRLAAGELLTINNTGRYLLVELPASMIPDYTARVLYDLQLQGITPILAHPERNIGFARETKVLADFVSRGILAQITAASITGQFGKSAGKTTRQLLALGCVHLIASDAHSPQGRPPILSRAALELERMAGAGRARILTHENPRRIIEGLPVETGIRIKRPSFWARFINKE